MPQMKTAEVTSKKAVVGHATFPVFDEKNPTEGLKDILGYDWVGAGYQSPEHAIVSLVNTQHATNIKNDIRAKASDKLTGEKLQNMALAALSQLPQQELVALASSGGIPAKVEELKAQIKAKHEADRLARLAALQDESEEGDEE